MSALRKSTIFCSFLALGVQLAAARIAWAQDMPLSQVLIDGENWRLVSEGHQFTEGPAVNKEGEVYFSDPRASTIHRIDSQGQVTLFAEDTGRTAGLMFGPDGRLYVCFGQSRRAAERGLQKQRVLGDAGLLVEAVFEDFNQYDGAESIGSRSALWRCRVTPQTKPLVRRSR